MIKDIHYGGLTAQPSDYVCSDGDLDLSLNLINEDSQINPIPQPDVILHLLENEKVLHIHTVSGQRNYILARFGTGSAIDVYWLKIARLITDTTNAKYIATFSGLSDTTTIGNTLVLALDDGLRYLLWKDGDYLTLKNRPPFISIDFGMYKVGALGDSEEYTMPACCAPHYSNRHNGDKDFETDYKEEMAQITQMAYGLLNSAVADKITSKGYFYQPFFVRYAYKLFDGTYSWHSAPVLMLPTILPPFVKYTDNDAHPVAGETYNATLSLSVPYFALAYRVLSDSVDELAHWSDIVTGIDIFISAPIYTYDQSKDLLWRPVTTTRVMLGNVSPDTETSSGGRPTPTVAAEVFVGHYADSINDRYIDHTMKTTAVDNPSFCDLLDIKVHDKFYENIQGTHQFYKLSSLDIKDISAMSEMTNLDITDINLSSLVARPTLDDDYQSHCNIIASSLYPFNSRLNLAGVNISPAQPLPLRSCMQFSNPDGASSTIAHIKVWTRVNGIRCYAVHAGDDNREADLWYNPENNFPRYIYYPDASAYKMEIFVSDTQQYVINLKPHDFLNGAYYFMGKAGMSKNTLPTNAEPETAVCDTSVSVGSKIYTSQVNNPFYFPLDGINTVGTGTILGICAAVRPLSQGQFGQFPLYAFTSDGIWALLTNAHGTYSACQPVSRDVCNNPSAITSLDTAVLFPTSRGIMMIEGSQTQCISDIIDTAAPSLMSGSGLPGLDTLHAMLGHDDTTCLPIAPFSDFLTSCGILYDYVHRHVIIFSTEHTYAYVYSLKSRQWGLIYSNIVDVVNSYPEALAVDDCHRLVDFSHRVAGDVHGLLVTRPLKLDAPDILKTVDTVIQRGHFRKGHVQSVLYGSRDLFNWHLVWSSRDHYLRGFRGTPYKYFRIALLADLNPGESIFGATVQFNPRLIDQPR